MSAASAVTHVVAGLLAVHGVSWALRDQPPNVAFVPTSLLPLISAPVWAPVDAWCQFLVAGILLGAAVALVLRKHQGHNDQVWPVAAAEAATVVLYFASLFTGNDDGGGSVTHMACMVVAALLLAGWTSSV